MVEIGPYAYIRYRVMEGVAEIVLNRPDKLNAFHLPMYREICSAFEAAQKDEDARVILLWSEGRAFSAGRDLKYSAYMQDEDVSDSWRRQYRLFTQWTLLNDKLAIALVHGYALGGGGSLAGSCDITLAAPGTKFGYPETRQGSAAKTMIWPWLFGPKVAKEVVASGRTITVDEAVHLGLVNRIVPAENLLAEGWALARDIARTPPGAAEIIKRRVNYVYRDMIRTIFDDRKFDIDTAAWDAAGVVPSPWMQRVEEAFHVAMEQWARKDDTGS